MNITFTKSSIINGSKIDRKFTVHYPSNSTNMKIYLDGNIVKDLNFIEIGNNVYNHGIMKLYWENGNVMKESEYYYDKLNGMEKEYYEDGKIKKEIIYNNGMRNGIQLTYYNNGNIKTELRFNLGQLNGRQFGFYEDGKIKYETNYIDGKEYGIERNYDEQGNVIIRSTRKN